MDNGNNMAADGLKRQRLLGDKGFVVFIAFLSAFIPLSTDIYLPALPRMVEYFNAPSSMISLTITFFFIFYAIGTMFWGPLSDKYGRKNILITGMSIYALASLLCVFSADIFQLIIFRILQSIGCGAATATATAIVKDVYSGRKRLTVLAVVQSMGMLSPIVSPLVGAIILSALSWRGIFVVLAVIGIISLLGSIAMEETLDKRNTGSILKSIGRLGTVAKNKSFTLLLLTFSIMSIASMSFITGSSYIYVDGFGLSESVFSYYFGANALFFMLGPLLYIKISKRLSNNLIINFSFIAASASGLLICAIGNLSPFIFAIAMVPASLFGSIIGPARTNLMLEQLDGDIGSASSLMSCAYTFFGSIGMSLISLDFPNRILVMGLLYAVIGGASLVSWNIVSRKPYVKH